MAKKTGLGKGLDALFSDNIRDEEENSGEVVKQIKITEIEPNIEQPRKKFDEEKLREYTAKFNEVKNDITNTQDVNEKTRKSIEAKGSFETIIRKLNTAINDAPKGNKSIKDLTELRDSIIAYNQQLMKESLGIDLGLGEN